MGTRENKVEVYLRNEIKKITGDTRKWVSPGRNGVPDQIIFLRGHVCFCEVKTTDGVIEIAQEREHRRLRKLGCIVTVVYGHKGVDKLIADIVENSFQPNPLFKLRGVYK